MGESARAMAEAMHDWRMKQPQMEVEEAQVETMAKFREAEERLRYANHNLSELYVEYRKMAQRKEKLLTRIRKDMLATSTILSSLKRKLANHVQEPILSPLEKRLSMPTTSSVAQSEAEEGSQQGDTAQAESASVGDTSPTLKSWENEDGTTAEEDHATDRQINAGDEGRTADGSSAGEEGPALGGSTLHDQGQEEEADLEHEGPANSVSFVSSSTNGESEAQSEASEQNAKEEEGTKTPLTPRLHSETQIPTHAFAHLSVRASSMATPRENEAPDTRRNTSPTKAIEGTQEFDLAPRDPSTSQVQQCGVDEQVEEASQLGTKDKAKECPVPAEKLYSETQVTGADYEEHVAGE